MMSPFLSTCTNSPPCCVAFSLPLRHGRSYMSIAECARLRLLFSYRIFQSLSKPRSCQVRYEKRLTRVRRILLFLCDPVGIRTQDPQLRRLLLYPAELPDFKAAVSECIYVSHAADLVAESLPAVVDKSELPVVSQIAYPVLPGAVGVSRSEYGILAVTVEPQSPLWINESAGRQSSIRCLFFSTPCSG